MGNVGQLLVALATVAVLTRFLPPAEFGEYTLFVVFASLLTLLYTLGTLRGAMRWVFGSGGDDEDEEDEEDESIEAPEGEKRRALGTALALITMIGALGAIVVWLLAPVLADLVIGDRSYGEIAVLAAIAGALLALWQLAAVVPRRERRPKTFVFLSLSRPLFVLVATVPLVAADPTVENAVVGLALGAALAALAALLVTRGSWRPAFRGDDVRNIMRLGAPWIPVNISYWVIANAGLFVLGAYTAASDVGLFRVAAGVAMMASQSVSAVLRAWGPLRREPIGGAVKAERGKVAAGALIATYFGLASAGILLAFALGAELLVRIAPPAYASAAPLIPLLGLAAVLQGGIRVVRRSTSFKRKRATYIWLIVLAAFVLVGAAFVLVPPLGAYGLALALIVAYLTVVGGLLIRAQRGTTPTPYDARRLLAGIGVAGGLYLVGRLGGSASGSLAPVVEVAAVLAYPVLIVTTGIVPRGHVYRLRKAGAAAIPGRSPRRNGHVTLSGVDETQRAMLELLIRHRRPVVDVATLIGAPQDVVARGFVAALRRAGGVGAPSEGDARIGAYLLASGSVADRDAVWRKLLSEGHADPLEADALNLTLERLRRAPAATWQTP